MFKIAKLLSIKIIEEDFDDSISGFFVKKNNKNIIGLNRSHSINRKRFTVAHEIGHFKLHTDVSLFVDRQYQGTMYRREDNSNQDLQKEKEANKFASLLLMPKDLVVSEFNKIDSKMDFAEKCILLSKKLKVSNQAMSYRLNALELLDYGY